MALLFLDPSGGMAGDMLLAALCGLGFDPSPVQDGLRRQEIDATVLAVDKNVGGIAGTGMHLEFPDNQPLRHLADVLRVAEGLDMPQPVMARCAAAFTRLAETEARVHGVSVDTIHFHEVGALDTVVDVCGAFWGLHELRIERVISGPIPWFGGQVECAHGTLPLPAPATLRLLRNKPVYPTDVREEIVTPTGALLLDMAVDEFSTGPRGTVLASATGYGTRIIPNHPNGLRAVLLDPKKD